VIQVIGRAFGILEYLADKGPSSVKKLAAVTGLKKGTLCNILKTMSELGYVEKVERGLYAVGARLAEVAGPQMEQDAVVRLGREVVVALADATEEAALIAVLREGERYILAEAKCRQGLTVNPDVGEKSVFYRATGWVLLGGLEEKELRQLVESRKGTIGAWEGSYEELKALVRKVRDEGLAKCQPGNGQVVGLAVPVLGREGKVEATLGVYLPTVRFEGSHRQEVVELIKSAGKAMSVRLSAEVGLARW